MSAVRLPRALQRRVLQDDHHRCAYCHAASAITGVRLLVDHVVSRAAHGPSEASNLCAACHSCNEHKGARSDALDPLTGERVPLFHPRRDNWRTHFRWSPDGGEIIGLTATGRATVAVLRMNHPEAVEARRAWAGVGWHPPVEDL